MNENNTGVGRMRDVAGRILWPAPHRRGPMASARRAVGAVTVVGTLVQVVVWLMIAVFTGGLDGPWWLLSAVGSTAVATALWLVDERGVELGLRHEAGDVR